MENQNSELGNILPENYLDRGIKSVLEKEGNTPHAKGIIQNLKGFKAFYDHAPNNLKKVILTTTIGVIILSACRDGFPSIDITREPIAITQDMYPVDSTKEPVDITQTIGPKPTQLPTTEPTIELIPTSTPFPDIKLLENLPNAGGEYSKEQLAVIDSDVFKEKVNVMNDWWSYWGNAEESQRPFHPTSIEVHIVPYFDNDNPQSFSLAIQAKMDDGNLHTFLQPIDKENAKLRDFPPIEIGTDGIPVEINYDIPKGLGPLEIAGNFGWDETYEWVKFDESGNMYQTINYITGQWIENEAFKEKNYNFIYTVTPERLKAEMSYWKLAKDMVSNLTEALGWPYIAAGGHIIGYRLNSYNDEKFLHILLATKGGIVKAKIDYVVIAEGPHPRKNISVTELTYEQSSKISEYLNSIINNLDETNSSGSTSISYIGITTINNDNYKKACLDSVGKILDSKELCNYDSSLNSLTENEIEQKLRNSIASPENQSLEEILTSNNFPLLSVEGNSYIDTQIPVVR